jgi:zinc protease
MKRSLLFVLLAVACGVGSPGSNRNGETTPPNDAKKADPDAWRSVMPKPGKPAKIAYPVPETATLDNGLSIWVLRRPSRVTSVSVVVRHGASAAPAKKSGLAALTARMLTEGTKKRSASALAEATESLGSTLGDDAGRDYMSVSLTTLSEDVPKAIELIAEVAQTPAFSPVEFARVQKEWLDGLALERQNPNRLASLAGLRLLLGETDGAPVGGSVPDVKKLTVGDLVAFHKTCFVPPSAALIVVGDVSLDSVKTAAQKALGAWKGKPPPEPTRAPEAKAPDKTRVVVIDRADSVQTALFVAQPFPSRGTPGHETREVLDNLLGGLFTSRINHNLREEHAYTYGAHSDAIATRRWGAFIVSTSVETNVTGAALTELLKEIARTKDPALKKPLVDEEVARAKTDLRNRLGAHLEEAERVAGDLESGFTLGLAPDYFARYGELIANVTKTEVAAQASAQLLPERALVVVVGDAQAVSADLKKHGFQVETAPATLSE